MQIRRAHTNELKEQKSLHSSNRNAKSICRLQYFQFKNCIEDNIIVLCRSTWFDIFGADTFYFYLFQCDVFPCLSIVLARDGNPLRTGAVGPFLMLCCFVVPAREGCATCYVM